MMDPDLLDASDFNAFDACAGCNEPLFDSRTCRCCRRAVCLGCAEHDRDDDVYCPECAADLRAFLAEGDVAEHEGAA